MVSAQTITPKTAVITPKTADKVTEKRMGKQTTSSTKTTTTGSKKSNSRKSSGGMKEITARNANLKTCVQQFEKQFGDGAHYVLGSEPNWSDRRNFHRKSILGLGTRAVGGIPTGRVIEIFGPESRWKNNLGAARCGRVAEEGRDRGIY